MGYSGLSNSNSAKERLSVFKMSEPDNLSEKGVYLGKTSIYKMPFLLDLSSAVNQHVAVIGMSGSGKSYMLKNLIPRLVACDSQNMLILDWNGEYSGTVRFAGGREYVAGGDFVFNSCDRGGGARNIRVEKAPAYTNAGMFSGHGGRFEELLHGVNSLNLHKLRNDEERKSAVYSAIYLLIEHMRRSGVNGSMRLVIVLDEAWKTLDNSDLVRQLYREGRKYGVSVITATQAVGDISKGVISNSACLFIFRLQGDDDLNWLVENGVVDRERAAMLGELPVGRCLVRIDYKKAGHADSFFIDKIDGFATDLYCLYRGGRMKFEVSAGKLEEAGNRLGLSNSVIGQIRDIFESGGSRIGLVELIKGMMRLGLDRPTIIAYMRIIGVSDVEVVEAYEDAKDVRFRLEGQ